MLEKTPLALLRLENMGQTDGRTPYIHYAFRCRRGQRKNPAQFVYALNLNTPMLETGTQAYEQHYTTRKRGRAQRVARPACALCNCAFLTYLQTAYATATWRITFDQHSAYSLLASLQSPPVQMHLKISGVTGPKFTKFVAVVIFFIDGVNATIRVSIPPTLSNDRGDI